MVLPVITTTKMAAGTPDMFPEAVSCVLRGWGALRLATEQNFGGPYSLQKAEWLEEVVLQFFVENADLEPFEVEDYLAALMNQEFDTLVEDGSLTKVSLDLCHLFQQCCVGNLPTVREFIEKAKTLPRQAISEGEGGGEDDSHQEADGGDISHVSDDGEGDVHMSSEGSAQQTADEDEGCRTLDEENSQQLLDGCQPLDSKVGEQMEDLNLQDPLQNGKDESGSEDADKDDEGWTVVSSKGKGMHKR